MSVKTPKRLVKITLPCTPSRHNTWGSTSCSRARCAPAENAFSSINTCRTGRCVKNAETYLGVCVGRAQKILAATGHFRTCVMSSHVSSRSHGHRQRCRSPLWPPLHTRMHGRYARPLLLPPLPATTILRVSFRCVKVNSAIAFNLSDPQWVLVPVIWHSHPFQGSISLWRLPHQGIESASPLVSE